MLNENGSSLDYVIKSIIFLADMDDFSKINEVYGRYFVNTPQPARSCVAVKSLPKNAKFEIEVIAFSPMNSLGQTQ